MRIVAFYDEFDTVATVSDLLKTISKIAPFVDSESQSRLLLAASEIFTDYLKRTKKDRINKEEFKQHAQELGLGPKAFLVELLDRYTFRETIRWQSDPNLTDGKFLIEKLQAVSF